MRKATEDKDVPFILIEILHHISTARPRVITARGSEGLIQMTVLRGKAN